MDLNIDNYTLDELFRIFELDKNNIHIDEKIIQEKLNSKIDNLKKANINELSEISENKAQLIDFFYKCFIKLNNSINEKKNDLIIQDNHFLINQKNNNVQEMINVDYKKGIINPLQINTLKKIININSKFRENYNSTLASDFIIKLPYTLKKVLSMRLLTYQLPHTMYTISHTMGSNYFFIKFDTGEKTLISLPAGSYDHNSIQCEINNALIENDIPINICYNCESGKMTFLNTDIENPKFFELDFNYYETFDNTCNKTYNETKYQLTLGWLLGFRGNFLDKNIKNIKNFSNEYNGFTEYTAECIYDDFGYSHFLLSINDFNNNCNSIFISPYTDEFQRVADNNLLAKLRIDNQYIEYPKRIYFGPTDINKLHIKIYDEFGRIIDTNNSDIIIELECDILYEL